MSELYRPSNGTEGDAFITAICEKCIYYQDGIGCPILMATMIFDIDEKEYPVYWVETKDGPECRMFSETEEFLL